MVTTPAQIANIALARIGVKAFIDDLDEPDSTEALVAKTVFDHVRDSLLAEFHWPFATKRITPSALSVSRSGWAYAYPLPAECIAAQGVYSGNRNAPVDQRIAFAVEVADDLGSRVFLTDQESPEILITARVTAVPVFSPLFVDALAWALAREFVLSIPVKPEMGQRADTKAEAALQKAKKFSLTEGQSDPAPESEFTRARY